MRLVISVLFVFLSFTGFSQCIVINEVMINGPGGNDGSGSPNTEEWVELYNTCNTAVDISCWVIADGDFSVTIPTGTTLAANDYYTIGSGNAGFAVDLNWATCGCAVGGSQIGIFTNGNEQLALVNSTGQIQDGIFWGNGQFPSNNTTTAAVGCTSQNLSFTNNGTDFESVPATGSGTFNGCTVARSCDGSDTWITMCNNLITPGTTNSTDAPNPTFSSSSQQICPGECVNFSDLTGSGVLSWTWTFGGAVTTNSNAQNPQQICYDNLGLFDVSLEITTACGVSSVILTDYISVESNPNPQITADGPLTICEGSSVTLQSATIASNYQWYQDGNAINNADQSTYVATESGDYTLETSNGSCSGISNILTVQVEVFTPPSITSSTGSFEICDGDLLTLSVPDQFDTYQWTLNGQPLPLENGNSLTTGNDGDYAVIIDSGNCSATTNTVEVIIQEAPVVSINPTGTIESCNSSVLINGTSNGSFQWYFNDGLIPNETTGQLEATEAGEYYFVALSSAGCESTSDVVEVIFTQNIQLEILATDESPCPGESVTLSIPNTFDTILWSNGQSTPTIQVSTSGAYSVTVSQSACNASDAVIITYSPAPTAVLNPSSDITTCDDFYTLSATSNGDIQWLLNGAPIIGSTANNLNAITTGTYSFSATSNEGCITNSNPVDVTFIEGIDVEIESSNVEVCQGQSITLSVDDIYDDVVWSNSETGNSITVTSGDIYTVEVTQNGCVGSAFIELTFNPIPIADAGNDTISDCDLGVTLMGTGTGILTWEAHPSIEDPTSSFTLVKPTVTTTYTLIATLGTCTATDAITVEADCTSLFIPNVFTPNGDGKNDYFFVEARGVKTFEMKIYNRWGQIVYETNDLNKPWTGGKSEFYAPDGTYFWTVIALDDNNQSITDKATSNGTVTILR